jgi:hypothetical protein
MDLEEAYWAAKQLYEDLQRAADEDAEQEIRGPAIDTVDAVLDAVLDACRRFLPDHPIVARLQNELSPEAIATGDPVRIVDVVPGVGQITTALELKRPPLIA